MTDKHWHSGEVILNASYTGVQHQPMLVFPAIVVEDNEDYLALYHPIDETFANADRLWPGDSRKHTPVRERVELMMQWECKEFREVRSRRHVLYLELHGAMHGVWLFWGRDWNLINWYVNFQTPYQRTDHGIAIEDYSLDIEMQPDFTWKMKDEDEYSIFCELGAVPTDVQKAIQAEATLMIRRIERREWPFNSDWPNWRPKPEWPVPLIAEYWERGKFPFPLIKPSN